MREAGSSGTLPQDLRKSSRKTTKCLAQVAGRVYYSDMALRRFTATTVLALGVGAAALTGCGSSGHTKTAAVVAPVNHTMRGKMVLADSSGVLNAGGGLCQGENGYDDLTVNASVTVYNQTDTVIATGQLGAGQVIHGQYNLDTCSFPIDVPNVPKATFYKVEVSHRGQVTFSAAEMASAHWAPALSVGS